MKHTLRSGGWTNLCVTLLIVASLACSPSHANAPPEKRPYIIEISSDAVPALKLPGEEMFATEEVLPSLQDVAHELMLRYEGEIIDIYGTALLGFAANIPAKSVKAMNQDARVERMVLDDATNEFKDSGPSQPAANLGDRLRGKRSSPRLFRSAPAFSPNQNIEHQARPRAASQEPYRYRRSRSGAHVYMVDTPFGHRIVSGIDWVLRKHRARPISMHAPTVMSVNLASCDADGALAKLLLELIRLCEDEGVAAVY